MPQIGTSSFYLCSKINEKASIMTAKQSKKQELDLLQVRSPRPYKGTKCNDVTIY